MTASQTTAAESINLDLVDSAVYRRNSQPGAMIGILQEVQSIYGYLPRKAILRIAELTHEPAADIYGIITFYAQFRLQPQGKHVIKVCHGTACHLNGAEKLTEAVCQCTGAKTGETSIDGKFTIEKVACIGCCSLAPTIMIDDSTYGRLTPDSVK
ncbi:MAG TPA: NADH-quinone oxidoreductase subunit NuoE, partial [Dehalococcoidales bacterium]|nr:NADH-quinone oxidoreductase subunit NuoE [Dehalococcoidales bacterium]